MRNIHLADSMETIMMNDSIKNLNVQLNTFKGIHPYGSGHGLLTIYSVCSDCDERVYVNDMYLGKFENYFSLESRNCMDEGTLYQRVLAGKVHITANDLKNGNKWDFYIDVPADSCITVPLRIK